MRLFAPGIDVRHETNLTGSLTKEEEIFGDEIFSHNMNYLWRHIGLIIMGFATICCIFANLLTIFVLARHPPLQKSISNLYILSLSIADMFIGIFVMSIMFTNELMTGTLRQFFGPYWLCQAWQISDFVLSTISLYSTCAIALDRVWNLEKPLRVFKRSRRIAKRLILVIWILPIVIWTPIYFLVMASPINWKFEIVDKNLDNFPQICFMPRHSAKFIPIIAVPLLYIPSFILIAMFVRISLVVHRHLKFLREHSNLPQLSSSPVPERAVTSNSNSLNKESAWLKTPECQYKRQTYDSLATVTSGYCTTTLKTPRSNSPWYHKSTEWQLAPLSEERSSGRERSLSEQINLTPEDGKNLETTYSRSHTKIEASPTRRQSIMAQQILLMQRAESFFSKKRTPQRAPSSESVRLKRAISMRSTRFSSTESTNSSNQVPSAPARFFRKISAISVGSKKFSVIAIPSNLLELIQREGVSQQVKAAKAVALITFCFLICWFPFLIVWPIKIYCDDCVPDEVYRLSIWLNYLCSSINPVLYTLSSPRVRSALKNYLSLASYGSRFRMKPGGAPSMYKSNTVV
uniref:G-protein coupled receptors family 1 profile domain-containing protein n=1 Tax=Acrobeloides nanus TaxID=290746 RepID=A0A914DQ59_9BILA